MYALQSVALAGCLCMVSSSVIQMQQSHNQKKIQKKSQFISISPSTFTPSTTLETLTSTVTPTVTPGDLTWVNCPDKQEMCPDGNTCCLMASDKFGCCPLPNAVCCPDKIHCCPEGTTFDNKTQKCSVPSLLNLLNHNVPLSADVHNVPVPADVHDVPQSADVHNVPLSADVHDVPLPADVHDVPVPESTQCPDGSSCSIVQTCCLMGTGKYGCCPHQKGVCCADKKHCCARGYRCDIKAGTCVSLWSLHQKVSTAPKIEDTTGIGFMCPNHRTMCGEGTTCCRTKHYGDYGCCSSVHAACCADGIHCCPQNFHCDLERGMCLSEDGKTRHLITL